jgi:hypothetical protein
MKRGMNTKGQGVMGLPFSVIFSIILIVFFIVVAIITIKLFWNPAGCGYSEQAQEATFKQGLQDSINDAWFSDTSSSDFKISLPSQIKMVCFLDVNKGKKGKNSEIYDNLMLYSQNKNNFYMYPGNKACEGFRGMIVEHVNISETTKNENPLCFQNPGSLKIEKGFYDALVKIS